MNNNDLYDDFELPPLPGGSDEPDENIAEFVKELEETAAAYDDMKSVDIPSLSSMEDEKVEAVRESDWNEVIREKHPGEEDYRIRTERIPFKLSPRYSKQNETLDEFYADHEKKVRLAGIGNTRIITLRLIYLAAAAANIITDLICGRLSVSSVIILIFGAVLAAVFGMGNKKAKIFLGAVCAVSMLSCLGSAIIYLKALTGLAQSAAAAAYIFISIAFGVCAYMAVFDKYIAAYVEIHGS